jgi:triosephosphate isomerase
MHKTIKEAIQLASGLKRELVDLRDVDVAVCPPFVCLADVCDTLRSTEIKVGAQNMHWEPKGAFTGEVSASMLIDAGCSFVILGHSERRQFFGETDDGVNRKLRAALAAGLCPIVCVGETRQQRESNQTEQVVRAQVSGSLAGLAPEQAAKLVIAYEPGWAIGTGLTATPAQAQDVHAFIRQLLAGSFGRAADSIRIQYGGSVKPDNIAALMNERDIDGALVGGASLEVDSFVKIVRYKEN